MIKNNLLIGIFIFTTTILYAQTPGFNIQNNSYYGTKWTSTKNLRSDQIPTSIDTILIEINTKKVNSYKIIINRILEELHANAISRSESLMDRQLIDSKLDSIKLFRNYIVTLETENDSLLISYKKGLIGSTRCNYGFNASGSQACFDILYNDKGKRLKTIGYAGLNFGNSTASIYSEIISGYLGAIRVSFGTMLTSNDNDSTEQRREEEAYHKLVTYGGNTVLNFEYPLVYYHSKNFQYNYLWRLVSRNAADLPAFGTSTSEWAGNLSGGTDMYIDASLSNGELRFFANANAYYYYGSDIYCNNLGVKGNNFIFGQATIGFVFLQNFKISFVVATYSSEKNLQNNQIVIGGQVLK